MAQNPCPNPYAANDLTGIQGVAGGLTRITTLASPWRKTTGAFVQCSQTATGYTEIRWAPYVATADITAGLYYSGTAQWMVDTAAGDVYVFLIYLSSTDGLVSYTTKVIPAAQVVPGTVYETPVTPAAAPSGARKVGVWVRQNGAPVGSRLYMSTVRPDQCRDVNLPYGDGTYSGWSWGGTAGVSASSSPEPAWNVDPAVPGAVTWALDSTKADVVAGGYSSTPWNRQTPAGNDTASGLVWPPVLDVAPFGRPGRAYMLRVPDGSKRYEVEPAVTNWAAGDAWWVGLAFCLDADYDRFSQSFETVWQLRPNDDAGSPPIELQINRDGGLYLAGGYNRPNAAGVGQGSTYQQLRRLADVEPRRWYNLVMFVGVWQEVNAGRFDIWLDGAPVLAGYRPPPGTTFPTQQTKAYPKNGLYRDTSNRGATVWYADHKQGTGFPAVNPAKTIAEYRGSDPLPAVA